VPSSTPDPGTDPGVAPPSDLVAVPGPTRANASATSTAPIDGPLREAPPLAGMPPRCSALPIPTASASAFCITDMPTAPPPDRSEDLVRSSTWATAPVGGPGPSTSPLGAALSQVQEQIAPHTRLQAGIWKPKIFKDGTVRYGNSAIAEEPGDLSAALGDPRWKAAMNSEFYALVRNKTWHLVPPAPGQNLIDCKWVFKIKRKADGTIDHYKARLIAKGFKQLYSIDYDDIHW
jgi:hypothetical protein